MHLGVNWFLPHIGLDPVEPLCVQGVRLYGIQYLDVLKFHPVTMPFFLKWSQAPDGYPPLQPFPQVNPQQVSRSSADILVYNTCPLKIQILSLMTSTVATAQQEPQLL